MLHVHYVFSISNDDLFIYILERINLRTRALIWQVCKFMVRSFLPFTVFNFSIAKHMEVAHIFYRRLLLALCLR